MVCRRMEGVNLGGYPGREEQRVWPANLIRPCRSMPNIAWRMSLVVFAQRIASGNGGALKVHELPGQLGAEMIKNVNKVE